MELAAIAAGHRGTGAGARARRRVRGLGRACRRQPATTPVRVHRWVEAATVVPREPVGADARRVGRSHARRAARARPAADGSGPVRRARRSHHRRRLARSRRAIARGGRRPGPSELGPPSPSRGAPPRCSSTTAAPMVMVHGDLDQKNLLVGADGPVLIDWDVVLPRVPAHDLAHAAVTMGSWRDAEAASAVVRGYRDAGGAATAAGAERSGAGARLAAGLDPLHGRPCAGRAGHGTGRGPRRSPASPTCSPTSGVGSPSPRPGRTSSTTPERCRPSTRGAASPTPGAV